MSHIFNCSIIDSRFCLTNIPLVVIFLLLLRRFKVLFNILYIIGPWLMSALRQKRTLRHVLHVTLHNISYDVQSTERR